MNSPARRAISKRRKNTKSTARGAALAAAERPLKIGEAARLLEVKPYVLRFWETEFPLLRPNHTASKHRLYTAKDIEVLSLIKRLLYEERFTIDGARRRLRELGYGKRAGVERSKAEVQDKATSVVGAGAPSGDSRVQLAEIRRELESIYSLLKG